MKVVRYEVRVRNAKGEVVTKRTFKVESHALEYARKKLNGHRAVTIKRNVERVESFRILNDWGNTTVRPAAPKPVAILVVHHSVTLQLSVNASQAKEEEQMRVIQSIGYSRDLGGFPYGSAIFPSGEIYRGSGYGVIEAATGGYNTPTDSVVLVGNYDVFEMSDEEEETLVALGKHLKAKGYLVKVEAALDPHSKYKATACPGSHVRPRLAKIENRING